jgi:carboxyl-terminal processing protease
MAPLGLGLLFVLLGAGGQPPPTPADPSTEANVTRLVAGLLEQSQFSHHPLDAELAGKFLDGYLDSLDVTRSVLLQSDVKEFGKYREVMAKGTRSAGDTSPARAIYARFVERLEQQTAYDVGLLKTTKFDFTGKDTFSLDREKAQRPADLTAAQALWRQALRAEYLQEKLQDKPAEDITKTLTRRHQRQLTTIKTLHPDEVLEIYLNSLAHVYDPHSDYLGHEQMESLSISMNLSLFGIGAVLESQDGYTKVRELVPGGPAARGGMVKPGDRIVAVAQGSKDPVDVIDMPLSRVVEMIRGPKGSTVVLTVIPSGGLDSAPRKAITIVRDEINLEDQQAKARILDLPTGKPAETLRVGVIDLPSFYADMERHGSSLHHSVTADVKRLVAKLKAEHVRGIAVDLRRNGGGSLEEAISLTGLFIRQGPVVETRDPTGHVEVGADTDSSIAWDGPLVLLTSRFSASASEILAGALQDYGRAVLVGDTSTFGKGTVQNVLPLASIMDRNGMPHAYDPGALKVTIRKFYRPAGSSTQLKGVVSDIVLPSTSDFAEISESSLKNPLPWDSINPQSFEPANQVKTYVTTLRERSAQRIKTAPAFARLAEDVARVKKDVENKSVSLNEAQRRQEIAQAKAREKARAEESKRLQAAGPTAYEITVKNAGSPGLPPPSKGAAPPKDKLQQAADGEDANSRAAAEDINFNEGIAVLADYVNLMGGKAPGPIATPGVSTPATGGNPSLTRQPPKAARSAPQ